MILVYQVSACHRVINEHHVVRLNKAYRIQKINSATLANAGKFTLSNFLHL